jgi:phage/plasmid-like protein (TIGR03299 family)
VLFRSLRGGRRVWILAKLGGGRLRIVKGDEIDRYVLLANSHDGTQAVRAGLTPIRVVCANTLAMAETRADGVRTKFQLHKVRHVAGMQERMAQVRDTVHAWDEAFVATADAYRYLAARQVANEETLRAFVRTVFARSNMSVVQAAADDGLDNESDQEVAAASQVRSPVADKVVALFEGEGRGLTMPGVKGTWWAAYNAVTEYVAWQRGQDAGGRLDSAWFGRGSKVIAKALQQGVVFANVA